MAIEKISILTNGNLFHNDRIMSEQISTYREVISLWPSRAVFAEEVGVSLDVVQKWAQGGSIPAKHFGAIISAAAARGLGVTAEHLVRIADRRMAS